MNANESHVKSHCCRNTSMNSFARRISTLLCVATLCQNQSAQCQDIDFNRDIRPILAENCFHCHGPDPSTRKADLRLDDEAAAKESVILVGNSAESELIQRLVSSDPDEKMPPENFGKKLTIKQIELLKNWIDGGAKWAKHWSFVSPANAPLPAVSNAEWTRNPIDHFVLAALDREQLKPSAKADRITLARRVAFDLTGLPPESGHLNRFLADESEDAYEKFVDELLASRHYGERMAMPWLDAARYADSDGYQADATRQNWPWRDWVIEAYNANMPFDQFTIEQFAGDLLNDATQEQILATCFHRNHMHNGEGGRDPEESRIEYVRDRVNTIGTVWLGLTLECAQCHSHKYDPIAQSEYYSLNAFFNSIDETGKAGGGAAPFLRYQSPFVAEGRNDAARWLQQMDQKLREIRTEELAGFDAWINNQKMMIAASGGHRSWKSFDAIRMVTTASTQLRQNDGIFEVVGPDPRHDDYLITITPQLPRITGMKLTVLPSAAAAGKLSHFSDGHIILTNLKIRHRSADGRQERDLTIGATAASYEARNSGRVYGPVSTVLDDDPRTGWMTTGSAADETKTATFVFAQPVVLANGESLVVELRQRSLRGFSNLQKFRLEFTDEPEPAAKSIGKTPLEEVAQLIFKDEQVVKELPAELQRQLQTQFLADRRRVQAAQAEVEKAKRRRAHYDSAAQPQNVTVLKERDKPRDTHLLVRGIWNNKGDSVDQSVPSAIRSTNPSAKNRLELAKWLVSRDHPLTSRVAVNRFWQMYFAFGLVRTPGDFGTQGEPPTHPLLLDWLAVEFMESGWDVQHMQRLIVTSATYQQTSDIGSELLKRDPQNRLLARATRFRLPSWMIRDAALAVSGLLTRRIGGPPVFAFQPEGAWLDATMGRFRYEPSVGSDLHRRSIYTFWRRSVGPTGMFDASKRRVCEVRSIRTNTPLHALNLMNDETFVEVSTAIAQAAVATNESVEHRVASVFRTILSRNPTTAESAILRQQYAQHVREYTDRKTDSSAEHLENEGSGMNLRSAESAAISMLATTIMNLDEAITHE